MMIILIARDDGKMNAYRSIIDAVEGEHNIKKTAPVVTATGIRESLQSQAQIDAELASLGKQSKTATAKKISYNDTVAHAAEVQYQQPVEGKNAQIRTVHPIRDAESRIVMADAYQDYVMSQADTGLEWHEQLLNALLGLGEVGEVMNAVKKYYFHPSRLGDYKNIEALMDKVQSELGDTLFYIAWIAKLFGWGLGDVMKYNYEKLEKRHRETGGFPKPSEQPDFTGSVFGYYIRRK